MIVVATCAHAAKLTEFVTSTTGTGNLSLWPEAGGRSGIVAGDAICQARAAAAGLPDPTTYVAWLSDTRTDAYCRVFGLSGTKATKCGQDTLPVGAGPWTRTDGVPFASTIEAALADNRILSPPSIDETGHVVSTATALDSELIFTDTNPDGTFGGSACANWTSTASLALAGDAFSAAGDWSSIGEDVGCENVAHLVCLQSGRGDALPALTHSGKREAFLSSAALTGNLGASPLADGKSGLDAGDAICKNLARAANLYAPQDFKALLASSVGDTHVLSRFQFDGPVFRADGLLLAHDFAELASGHVSLPLNLTETGDYIGEGQSAFFGDTVAWMGALSDGSPSGQDCNNWSEIVLSASTSSAVNNTGASGLSGSWLGGTTLVECNASARLFCLQDSDVLFHAGFEF
jgi:hypothetical protein